MGPPNPTGRPSSRGPSCHVTRVVPSPRGPRCPGTPRTTDTRPAPPVEGRGPGVVGVRRQPQASASNAPSRLVVTSVPSRVAAAVTVAVPAGADVARTGNAW